MRQYKRPKNQKAKGLHANTSDDFDILLQLEEWPSG
jgi:hypothetical protein